MNCAAVSFTNYNGGQMKGLNRSVHLPPSCVQLLSLYNRGTSPRDSHPLFLPTGGVHRRNDDIWKPGLNRSSGLACSCTRLLCPCCPDAKTQPSLTCEPTTVFSSSLSCLRRGAHVVDLGLRY